MDAPTRSAETPRHPHSNAASERPTDAAGAESLAAAPWEVRFADDLAAAALEEDVFDEDDDDDDELGIRRTRPRGDARALPRAASLAGALPSSAPPVRAHGAPSTVIAGVAAAAGAASDDAASAAPFPRVLAPLSASELALVDDALRPGRDTESLPVHCIKGLCGTKVTYADLRTLRDGEWLNDEIVNAALAVVSATARPRAGHGRAAAPRVHFFNSFFYAKLYSDAGVYDYSAVRRWTAEHHKIDYCVLDCELVVVPIHQMNHWVLGVIDMQAKRVLYYDSLGGVDRTAMDNLLSWFVEEASDKRNDLRPDAREWAAHAPRDIPQQLNGCDCGAFAVLYALHVLHRVPLRGAFSQHDMPLLRRRLVVALAQQRLS